MDLFRNSQFSQARYFRRIDSASSPFLKHITNPDEMRSRLFPDKRRIPGRRSKCVLALFTASLLWGSRKIVEIKQFNRRRHEDTKREYRQVAPFLQANNDLRYLAQRKKADDIIHELFEHRGEEYIKRITTRYHQTDVWAPYQSRYSFMYQGSARNTQPYRNMYHYRFLHNIENKGI